MKIKDMIQILVAVWLFAIGTSIILNGLKFYWGFLVAIIFLIIYKLIDGNKFSYYGIKKFNFRDIKKGYLFLTLLFPISLIARLLDPGFDAWYAPSMGINSFTGFLIIAAIMPLFMIREEIIERSLIQIKLSKVYGKLLTIVMIGINFGLLHFYITHNGQYHIFMSALFVVFGGIILASLFEITKNLFLTIIIHTFYNIIIMFQIYLHVNNGLYEIIFWVILMILFLISAKKSIKLIKDTFTMPTRKLTLLEKVFFIVFILFPLLWIFS